MNEKRIKKSINQERADIYKRAFRRLCELEGVNHENPMEKDFWVMIMAYEECLTEKNGKVTRATYTRRKIKSKGFKQCLVDWATKSDSTKGFDLLIERGMFELTGEFLVIKYKERFEETVVSGARRRLAKVGLSL